MAVLSPDEAAELKERWLELLAPYVDARRGRTRRPEQRHVRCFMATTPLIEAVAALPEDAEHG